MQGTAAGTTTAIVLRGLASLMAYIKVHAFVAPVATKPWCSPPCECDRVSFMVGSGAAAANVPAVARQVLLIALVVGLLRVIYFLAVRATRATGSAGTATPAVTGESWNAAQAADTPSENVVASKVHQASLMPHISACWIAPT